MVSMICTPCVGYFSCTEETDKMRIHSWNCHNGDYKLKYNLWILGSTFENMLYLELFFQKNLFLQNGLEKTPY